MDKYYWDSFDCEIQCEEYYNEIETEEWQNAEVF